jgi:hypothetical protein
VPQPTSPHPRLRYHYLRSITRDLCYREFVLSKGRS